MFVYRNDLKQTRNEGLYFNNFYLKEASVTMNAMKIPPQTLGMVILLIEEKIFMFPDAIAYL